MVQVRWPDLTRECELWSAGWRRVAGVDEVGRGPLAGPLVTAAVVLSPFADYPWLAIVRDSKQLTSRRRACLAPRIRRDVAFAFGATSPAEIDRLGVAVAGRLAMCRAVRRLRPAPDFVLVDGFGVPELDLPHRAVVRGDEQCATIAAASVLAKVLRDDLMRRLDARLPGYGFARHAGYGTAVHREAIRRLGPSPLHRRSFLARVLEERSASVCPAGAVGRPA